MNDHSVFTDRVMVIMWQCHEADLLVRSNVFDQLYRSVAFASMARVSYFGIREGTLLELMEGIRKELK